MIQRSVAYSLLVITIFTIDRLTKAYAMSNWCAACEIHPNLFSQVSLNRGISWGMLNYDRTGIFIAVTVAVLLVTAALAYYAYRRLQQGKSIVGELCVITGSLSNSFDRIICKGVIDFIVVHKGLWAWPVFNVADACIVLGVALMFFQLIREHD